MKSLTLIILFLFSIHSFSQCFQEISTDGDHTLVLKTDGTLWSWGYNYYGQLGVNSTATSHDIPLKIGHDTNWAKIFASVSRSFAIKSDGTLWASGQGSGGGLGTGNQNDKIIITQIGTDIDWNYVTSGAGTLALKTNGTLWGWGSNIYGMLGLGYTSLQLIPIQISSETNWSKVVAGSHYTLAIKNDGTLWSCGKNISGQLGDGSNTDKYSFTQIGTDNDWVEITTNHYSSSLAVKSNGTLWGWGENRIVIPFVTSSDHIFNSNLSDNFYLPTQINGIQNCSKIEASYDAFTILKTDGTIWRSKNATGLNQIGVDTDWNILSGGSSHFFALKNNGTLWGYGYNNYGQLGMGPTPTNTEAPLQLNCSSFLDVKEINSELIKVFPNPTNDKLFIENMFNENITNIILTDTMGRNVLEIKNLTTYINMQNFENGIYILSIILENKIYRLKIIKE